MVIVKVACQLRDELSVLRKWLRRFQAAIDDGDIRQEEKYHLLLEAVSKVNRSKWSNDSGQITFSLSFSGLSMSGKLGAAYDALKARFPVRAQINRLLYAPSTYHVLDKLLKMAGEEHSVLGESIREECRRMA